MLEFAWQQNENLKRSIEIMTSAIASILGSNKPSIYLYGSVVLEDFRQGWSDIDILVLTESQILPDKAASLVKLRQTMLENEPENCFYRSFEGGMISLSAFLHEYKEPAVYWGTSGERITYGYRIDSFAQYHLKEKSVLLFGQDVRDCIQMPTEEALCADVKRHFDSIRKYAIKTERSIYSFGWLLDIARCIYTLRTGKIIAKTAAGEWALENDLCPDWHVLEGALTVRRNPVIYRNDTDVLDEAEHLGEAVQRFADVLEREIVKQQKYDR